MLEWVAYVSITSTISQNLFIGEAMTYPYMYLRFPAQYQAHRNYSKNICWFNEIINQPMHRDILFFVLSTSSQPASLFYIPVCLPTGGSSTNLFAWRQAKCIALDWGLVTPIVTSPLLLIAGLIKHSKLCPPTLNNMKAFLDGQKKQDNRFKLKQKTESHSLLGSAWLPYSSGYLSQMGEQSWPKSQPSTASTQQRGIRVNLDEPSHLSPSQSYKIAVLMQTFR